MNSVFRNITLENYIELKQSFERSKAIFWSEENEKLIHPGEYGSYREDLLKKFLRLYIPENFGISSGFIITSENEISNQCDLIIYDKTTTPKILNSENQRFFPVETVLGVGEVKSNINSPKELNDYLIKLSKIKKLRSSVREPEPYRRGDYTSTYNPKFIFSDNIFTFLICKEFNFAFDIKKINYQDTPHYEWHNLVLSLNNGLISYKKGNSTNIYTSFLGDHKLDFHFLPNDDSELPRSIEIFLAGLTYCINQSALLKIHIENYLTPIQNLYDKI